MESQTSKEHDAVPSHVTAPDHFGEQANLYDL